MSVIADMSLCLIDKGGVGMIRFENQCVGCPPEMDCFGNSCRYKNVPVLICDECGDETDEMWYGEDGKQYCHYCITHHLEKVEVERE